VPPPVITKTIPLTLKRSTADREAMFDVKLLSYDFDGSFRMEVGG